MPKKQIIIIATKNNGKIREIKRLLCFLPISIKTLNDFSAVPKIIENGKSFAENAKKKAENIAKIFGAITLADDSGLEVATLGGKPGIHSARFVRPPVTSERLCSKLLKAIKQSRSNKRGACFVCAVAIASPGRKTRVVHGFCKGRIIKEMRGRHGFGYDPVFFLPDRGVTVSQLPADIKNIISHRGQAFAKFKERLAAGF